MLNVETSLTSNLKQARNVRRLSQLELALELGVSQRHISFVESGRARPSRPLLLAWLKALDTPLLLSNETLRLAGYAPAYPAHALDDPQLNDACLALEQLLKAHEPTPALILDAEWNVVRMNAGAAWLASALLPETASPPSQPGVINMLDLLTRPEGFADRILNLQDVGPRFLRLIRQEAVAHPALQPRVDAYRQHLVTRLGETAITEVPGRESAPALTTRFSSPYGNMAFLSLFTTFGTPYDITLASLRMEHLFPADDATRTIIQRHAGNAVG